MYYDRAYFSETVEDLFRYTVSSNLMTLEKRQELTDYIYADQCQLSSTEILARGESLNDPVGKALVLRIYVTYVLLELNQSGDPLPQPGLNKLWRYLLQSLLTLNNNPIVSSIGSQGFLSIPLFRSTGTGDSKKMKILRLHIWDKSFNKLIDQENLARFSIHCHVSHAQSWIVYGEMINTTFDIRKGASPTGLNFFRIDWEAASFNVKDNNKRSFLINTNDPAEIVFSRADRFTQGKTYSIGAGEFHTSATNPVFEMNATFFLFNAENGWIDTSYVLGPEAVSVSQNNNYPEIDCVPLLEKLNSLLSDSDRL